MEAVMPREIDEGAVVDDAAGLGLADHGGLHPIVEHFIGRAAQCLEGGDVAAQHRWQVLMDDEACPDQSTESEHHREQPDDPRRRRLIGEDDLELGKIDLSLFAGRRLEAHLEA